MKVQEKLIKQKHLVKLLLNWILCEHFQVFIAIAALVAVSSGAPRYLVIPIEDVDFGNSDMAHRFPIYRMPALARQARAAQQEEDSFQIAPQLQQRQAYEPETSAR